MRQKKEWLKIKQTFELLGNDWSCYGKIYQTAHSNGIFLGQCYDRQIRLMKECGLIEYRETGHKKIREFRLAKEIICKPKPTLINNLKTWLTK